MLKTAQNKIGEAVEITLHLLDEILGAYVGDTIGVRLWEGTLWPDQRQRAVTVVLNHPGALRAIFLRGTELAVAEGYLYNDYDIEGDIFEVFRLIDMIEAANTGWTQKVKIARELMRLPQGPEHTTGLRGPAHLSGKTHSIERDRQAIQYHYDVSTDFYQLFLDKRLIYSCGYFEAPETDIDTAQQRKLDLICRKLRLQPGMRLLDIGCGWGGLVIFAAQNYGVDATGITLSPAQIEVAEQRIRSAGLSGTCRVELRDYREMDENRPFDAIASVGMVEHVGSAMMPVYFKKAYRLLKPRGVFMNHGIAMRADDDSELNGFSSAYVFPDGELLPISRTLTEAENAGFEVRDVESLREHYALTLHQWVRRLEAHHAEAVREVGEVTYRVWRLYMSGSAYGFTHNRLNVYQALLSRSDGQGASGLPLLRTDWYP
jgi:cyclopropane-fatty-acyl-phospholipid synthase